ncbi:MAG: ester cyclase, partial [Chloroflexi bacterium]|nr:ester cyclase [Chloroflexota bacterium]
VLLAGRYRDQDWVSASGYFSGTFVEDWNGIAATGKKTLIRFGEIMALEAGKIVKTYFLLDLLDVMQQGGFQLGWDAPAIEGLRPKVKIGSGALQSEQSPEETRRTLLLVEAMLFGLVRKDQPMELYWDPEMIWNSPSGIGSARNLDEFLDKVHEVFLHGLSGTWEGSHNARDAEGRFAVSSGWPSLVAVHNGDFLTIPATGNTLRWRIMDFWEREDEYLIRNWVHIDMIDIFKQMGVDVFERLRASASLKR